MVSSDEDVIAYVKLLEDRTDERNRESLEEMELPSGDALAAELETFLRNRGHDD